MIPRLIHQVWLGDPPSRTVQEWQRSWPQHHEEWGYRIWREEDLDWLQNAELFQMASLPAIKADIARIEILHRYGGLYVDSDIEAHRPIDRLIGDMEFVAVSEGDLISNAFIASTPEHPLINACFEGLRHLDSSAVRFLGRTTLPPTGPLLLTRAFSLQHASFNPGVRVLAGEVMQIPRSRNVEIQRLAAQRRWATHHAMASWRNSRSWTERVRRTRIRTRFRRFIDLSSP